MNTAFDHHGVYAVPPVARRSDENRTIDSEENLRVVRHVAAGGVRRLLYGGNGNLYHMRLRDYESLLECLSEAPDELTVVPSVGPAYGRAMEQAEILRHFRFAAAMALPGSHPRDAAGLDRGYREIVDAAGIPILLYLKSEDDFGADVQAGLDVIARLIEDGVSVGIKYAVVREDPGTDPYLDDLLARVDRKYVISGLGERPVVIHLQQWNLPGFTTGSGCVNPSRVQSLYDAAARGDFDEVRDHRKHFMPLEILRDRWGPVPVLHEAVDAAGIARIGPALPFVGTLTEQQRKAVAGVARDVARAEVSA